MRKHVLVLTTTAAILAFGTIAASAQAPSAQTPGTQQSQPTPGGMMGGGMVGRGMMGGGYGHHGAGPMMRIIFSLMDADGDGTLTLQEWQAAHERIFKEMDTDHDGTVSLEEMQAFLSRALAGCGASAEGLSGRDGLPLGGPEKSPLPPAPLVCWC
jgi:hypothetical protein